MQLLKVSDGLLEVENFYLTSSFSDFLGEGTTHRDSGLFYIDVNTKIERNFNYSEFLIEIEKENWININKADVFQFYVIHNNEEYGVEDNFKNLQSQYQKIIYNDKYLQCYVSDDNLNWVNVGGLFLDSIDKQGFKKSSANPIILKNYKVYKNPFLTIQNFDENVKVELYDSSNNKLKERLFDSSRKCEIYLDSCLNGHFKFYDTSGNLIYQSQTMYLKYGDVYFLNPYSIELIYRGVVLDDSPTCLYDFTEEVILKNISTTGETYTDLNITTKTKFDDTVLLSLDNVIFSNSVIVNTISPNDEVSIYIQITKGLTNHNFECRDFEFEVTKIK